MSQEGASHLQRMLPELVSGFAMPGQPQATFRTLEGIVSKSIGCRIFTIMLQGAGGEAERVYTNQPVAYPVGGRKKRAATPWSSIVIDKRQPFLARTESELRWAYPDYELVASLGCGTLMNLPIVFSGEMLGLLNLGHEAGRYDEADMFAAAAYATLLGPLLLQWRGAA